MTAATRPDLSPRLLRAYRATRYEACGIAIRIGRRCAAMDALLARLGASCGGFVTAWNPRSRRLPDTVNRRRQARLEGCIRRLQYLPARAALGRWHEALLLVAADHRVLAVAGRRFGQHAIVALRRNQPARLVLL